MRSTNDCLALSQPFGGSRPQMLPSISNARAQPTAAAVASVTPLQCPGHPFKSAICWPAASSSAKRAALANGTRALNDALVSLAAAFSSGLSWPRASVAHRRMLIDFRAASLTSRGSAPHSQSRIILPYKPTLSTGRMHPLTVWWLTTFQASKIKHTGNNLYKHCPCHPTLEAQRGCQYIRHKKAVVHSLRSRP